MQFRHQILLTVAATSLVWPASALEPVRLDTVHLPNAYQIHSKVISGGLPEGDAAFQELAALGVKTIISVDGATPDVATAEKYALRYVHLPHGYDGISEQRAAELAKAVRDLPGPIYIHCHHGKHRSPAAATTACVTAGMIDPSSPESILKRAGTSESYVGLYRAVRQARPLEPQVLDNLKVDFPAVAKLPPLAETMVAIEHAHDHLKEMAAAGWKAPPKHPDLQPAHEALLLREHFTELLRMVEVQQRPRSFQQQLRDSEHDANDLENALRRGELTRAATALERVSATCTACHRQHRDNPTAKP